MKEFVLKVLEHMKWTTARFVVEQLRNVVTVVVVIDIVVVSVIVNMVFVGVIDVAVVVVSVMLRWQHKEHQTEKARHWSLNNLRETDLASASASGVARQPSSRKRGRSRFLLQSLEKKIYDLAAKKRGQRLFCKTKPTNGNKISQRKKN